MDKLVSRFFPTLQFVLGALLLLGLTGWISYHFAAGHMGILGLAFAAPIYFLVCRMVKIVWVEMRKAYKEDTDISDYAD